MVYESYTIYDDTKGSEDSQTVERSLLACEVICNSLSKFTQFTIAFANKPQIRVETRLLVKRKLFLEETIEDAVEDNLMYHQVRKLQIFKFQFVLISFFQLAQSIHRGELVVNESDAIALGGLWLQITSGDYSESKQISPLVYFILKFNFF